MLQYCQDGPTVYFFFDFNDEQKRDPKMMVRSLLRQLLQSNKIPASLDDLFTLCESGQRPPPVDALQEVLRSIIQELPEVYVVLDALDECAQHEELMQTLKAIAGWKLQNLHLLVTSRREHAIESTLEEFVDS